MRNVSISDKCTSSCVNFGLIACSAVLMVQVISITTIRSNFSLSLRLTVRQMLGGHATC